VCGECHENIVHGGEKSNSFTTLNLCKHLKVHHLDRLKELEKSEKATETAIKDISKCQSTSTVITLKDCFEWTQSYPMDHLMALNITHLIREIIVVDCQPFSIVEDEGFIHLLKKLQPCCQIPSHK